MSYPPSGSRRSLPSSSTSRPGPRSSTGKIAQPTNVMIREEFMVPGASTNFVAVMTDTHRSRCYSLQQIINALGNNIFQMPALPKNMQSHRAEIINGINILADMLQSLKDSYSSTSNVLKAIASGRPAQNVMPEVDKSLALLHTSIDTINIVIPLFNANVEHLLDLSRRSPNIAKALTKWHVAAIMATVTVGAGVVASSMNFAAVQNHFHSSGNFDAAFGIVASVCGGLYTILTSSSSETEAWHAMAQTQKHLQCIGDATESLIALLMGLRNEWDTSVQGKIKNFRFNAAPRGGTQRAAELAQTLDEEAAGMIGMRQVLASKFSLLPPEAPRPLPAVNNQRRTQPGYHG